MKRYRAPAEDMPGQRGAGDKKSKGGGNVFQRNGRELGELGEHGAEI